MTLTALLTAALHASTIDSAGYLSHALRLADEIEDEFPHAPRIARICDGLRRLSETAEPPAEAIGELVNLCADLQALDGVGLATEAYDSLWISSWIQEAARSFEEARYPGIAEINIIVGLSCDYDSQGFRQLDMIALVTPRSFADVEAGCRQLMTVLAEFWTPRRPGRLIVAYEMQSGIIPETGLMMHRPTGGSIFPFEMDDDWLAEHDLASIEKAPGVSLLDDAITRAISAASWTEWLNAEASREVEGLERRRRAIASECHRRVTEAMSILSSLSGTMTQVSPDTPDELLADVDEWADTCAGIIAAGYEAATEGKADRGFLDELAAFRDGELMQPAIGHVIAAYLDLRISALDAAYL